MASIFTKIVNGEIPCYKIAEDDTFLAFLDITPFSKGHTLVIPKREEDYIFDLTDEEYVGLMKFSKKVALAIEKIIPCKRISVMVLGLEVPHTHVHLIPTNTITDVLNPHKLTLPKEEMGQIAKSIGKVFED